jgi:diguanylate cyclase (GGDEF)-like protein
MTEMPSALSGTPLPTLSRTIRAAGRVWRLDVTTTIQAGAQPQLVTEPAVMLVGLSIAMVLMAFLLLISGLERQARREAEIDPLTGLYNRRALLSRLEFARRISQANGTSHVLLFLDLDRFKAVNDSAGHAAGDTLLQGLAGVLRQAVRESDTVARVGGDEFAIILLDCNANRGWSIAEQVVQDVRSHSMEVAGRTIQVGVSVGLAMISPPDPEDVGELLRHADRASYVAKFAGGNRVVQHKPEVSHKT